MTSCRQGRGYCCVELKVAPQIFCDEAAYTVKSIMYVYGEKKVCANTHTCTFSLSLFDSQKLSFTHTHTYSGRLHTGLGSTLSRSDSKPFDDKQQYFIALSAHSNTYAKARLAVQSTHLVNVHLCSAGHTKQLLDELRVHCVANPQVHWHSIFCEITQTDKQLNKSIATKLKSMIQH